MITTGVTGHAWRAAITPWGRIEPWDDAPPLDWFVAAEDRWHRPADETTVRQTRIAGTAVVETRVRVPTGDVVQRIHTVADEGGVTVVTVENESAKPVAIAFSHRALLTERPIADVPIEGIDLPAEAFVVPLGHRASIRIGLPHDDRRPGPLPAALPTVTQVVRGWTALTERAGRYVLPDGASGSALAERVTAERCELALGVVPHADHDPAGFAVALGELVRMGERTDAWIPELVDAVERLGPISGWDADAAFAAAGRVLVAADEDRARRDLRRIVEGRTPAEPPPAPPDGVRAVAWLESRLVDGGALLPAGLPTEWLGHPVEAYGLPTGDSSTLSYALRWHGTRPAVLWEQSGPPVELTAPVMAPGWRTGDATGEALWPVPPGARPTSTDEPVSFG